MPFRDDRDAPGWVRAGLSDPWQGQVLPEIPAALLEAPSWDEPPLGCVCCVEPEPEPVVFNVHHAPDALAARFAAQWTLTQQQTARMWRAAAAMYAATGPAAAQFVADDIAMITGLHPRAGLNLVLTGEQVCAVPQLIALVESGQLSSRHAEALLEEAGRWTDTDAARTQVLELTLARCQAWVDKTGCWPTPSALRKRLRTAALLLDLTAAEKRKRSVAERRGVALSQSGIGQATLTVEGPEVAVAQMMDCIRARAEALGRLPGDARSLDQRMFDAAQELLVVDADGGQSAVPSIDDHAQPVTIRVRGVEISVLVPFSVAAGGDLELAEIPGLGPILPSAARELLPQAEYLRRVAVDADTGQVIAVDDRIAGPAHQPAPPSEPAHRSDPDDDPDGDPDGDDGGSAGGPYGRGPDDPGDRDPSAAGSGASPGASPGAGLAAGSGALDPRDTEDATHRRPGPPAGLLTRLLQRFATDRVVHRDLRSTSYRVNSRIRRFVEHRDRTCTFPGCTVPGRWCDIDHREPWPLGPTDRENCHCLCRRHHRAKQAYFTVTLDQRTGDTLWTTPDGRTYRRPPPAF